MNTTKMGARYLSGPVSLRYEVSSTSLLSHAKTNAQAYFKKRLAEAKRAVVEPPQPKVKLRLSAKSPEPTPKITLRFGGQKSSGPASVSVDSEALKRQQDLVKAGANGQGAIASNGNSRPVQRNPFRSSNSGSGSTPIPALQKLSQERSQSDSAEHPKTSANGVKAEAQLGQSPSLGAVQLNRDTNNSGGLGQSPSAAASIMPPPSSVTPRLPSGSPHPQAVTTNSQGSNSHSTTTAFDPRWRPPGKGERC